MCAEQYAGSAFSGEGSYKYGGRWHPKGCRVVYVAENISLASYEILVRMDPMDMKAQYVVIPLTIPDHIRIVVVDQHTLPKEWRNPVQYNSKLKMIGQEWLECGDSPILQVPSAISPFENNFLINIEHEDFHTLKIGKPMPFIFDARLFKSS